MKIEGHGGIQFWLNRVAEEECIQATTSIKNAMVRNWQAINFKSMQPDAQEGVLFELEGAMKSLGWNDAIKDLIEATTQADKPEVD